MKNIIMAKLGLVLVMFCIVPLGYAADTVDQADDASINASIYMYISNGVFNEYQEDLNYSSKILDEFVKGNISKRDAMIATTSLFTLTSQTAEAIVRVSPPPEFADYHDNSVGTLVYFKAYLWSLAKFYETGATKYAVQANDSFNISVKFYEAAKIELDKLLIDLEQAEMERLILTRRSS